MERHYTGGLQRQLCTGEGKRRPVCSTGSVGGCNDPQQAGNRLYMPPCGCTRRRRHKQRSEDVASGKDVLSLYGAGRGGGQGRTRIRAYHKQTVTAGRSRSTTAAVIRSYTVLYGRKTKKKEKSPLLSPLFLPPLNPLSITPLLSPQKRKKKLLCISQVFAQNLGEENEPLSSHRKAVIPWH